MASERMEKLRDSTDSELRDELMTVQRALFSRRTEIANQASENTASLGKLRREVAQIKTVLAERRASPQAASGDEGKGDESS